MPVKVWKPETPETVIRHGWRDRPYSGKDRCTGCFGWGTRSVTIGEDCVIVHRTCPDCSGTGHK